MTDYMNEDYSAESMENTINEEVREMVQTQNFK